MNEEAAKNLIGRGLLSPEYLTAEGYKKDLLYIDLLAESIKYRFKQDIELIRNETETAFVLLEGHYVDGISKELMKQTYLNLPNRRIDNKFASLVLDSF